MFNFSLPDEALSDAERIARALRAARVARSGEAWISHFGAAALVGDPAALGFSEAHHCAATEANECCFSNRADGLSLRGLARIMTARTWPAATRRDRGQR